MPSVYLSPSTQEYNKYYDGDGNEEFYMNQVVDFMEPYLTSSGITYNRNDPGMTAGQSASQSNEQNYGLHLAVHSNAAGVGNSGNVKGADVYYYTGSVQGKRAANIIAENFKKIYPEPSKVQVIPNSSFVELRRTKAPAVLIEVAYHDNPEDAEWIRSNLQEIGENLSESVAEFFDVPFDDQPVETQAVVNTHGARLNLRATPSLQGEIIGKIPDRSYVIVKNYDGDWAQVEYDSKNGYAYSRYLSIT